MKCEKCGHEYTGNFCQNCGSKSEFHSADASKKKKKFKWWYILVIIVAIGVIGSIGNGGKEASAPEEPTSQTDADKNESKAKQLKADAKSAFDDANYPSAMEKCALITSTYPETETAKAIPAFIEELNASLPHLSSVDLCEEYASNEVKADEAYRDKLVVISGKVSEIGKDFADNVYITMGDGNEYSFAAAQFTFKADSEIAKVAELKKGSPASVIGVCDGVSIMQVMLDDCYFES